MSSAVVKNELLERTQELRERGVAEDMGEIYMFSILDIYVFINMTHIHL